MATVANLDINLRGNTKNLEKGLKKGKDDVSGFSKSVNGLASGISGKMVAGVAAVAGGVYAAVASFHALNEQIEEVSKIVDASNRIGIGTEALIGLQYAATQAGMSADEMTGAIETMGNNVAKASMGLGRAQFAIKALGLNAKELDELSPEEKMNKIADALQQIGNTGDRAAYATAIFGDSKILNALEGGSEQMQAMADRAKYLGLTLSDEAAAGIEATGDSLADINNALTGAARQLTATFAPAIQAAAEAVTNGIVHIREWLTQGGNDIGSYVNEAAAWLDNIGNAWEAYKATAALTMVGLYEDLKHIFLDVLPTVFTEFGSALMTELDRMGKNIGEFMNAVWQYAMGDEDAFKDMLSFKIGDAFSAAMDNVSKQLPREMSDWEKELADEAGKAYDTLNKGLQTARDKRAQAPEIKPKGNLNAHGTQQAKGNAGQLTLAEKGTQEAYKVIADIMNKKAGDEELAEDSNDKLGRIADSMEEVAGIWDNIGVATA